MCKAGTASCFTGLASDVSHRGCVVNCFTAQKQIRKTISFYGLFVRHT